MTIYYFHLRDGEALVADETGLDLADRREAHREAVRSARDFLAEQLRAGEALDGQRIEVTDESGELIDVVLFRDALKPDVTIN